MVPLATPTRFLIENGEWNLTPGLSIQPEMNPFDCSLNDLKHSDNHVVTEKWSSTQSNSTASPIFSRIQTRPQPVYNNSQQQQQQQQDIDKKEEYPSQQRKPSTSGRKRRIVFEGEDAEDRRKKFLERNRIAAYKCRQKKKNWMQELEQKAEIQNMQNETLRTLVGQLKEESMYLKNLLLTHGNCDCESVQAYLRKTSMEITNSTSPLLNSTNHNPYALRRESMYSTASYPTNISSNTSYPASGLTPFLNTVINKPPMTEADYFSHSHHHHGKTNDIEA
ncbi:hypothetical protein BDF20DRAFT_819980 [Mycotypha africana]|uniref:uncharacterized protein n=1 Tax=Mycotypha africana TaxID=64632 RepID=UPI0023016400|nr:uncharacterized protein BDF20DRAFT_819980 [Mycotypha africana]KAI8979382.1 hypothetical protein BDF20DRAFT_819980 [Mycotypha africana]